MSPVDTYRKLLDDPVWGPECRTIAELGESAKARPAVVGGAVRDLLIGRPIRDLDIATGIPDTARALAKAFAGATGRVLVEYTHKQTIYRVVGRGQPQVDFTDPIGGTREADLLRRDFTLNAIGLELVGEEKGELHDPTGGIKDLESGIVRVISPEAFDDDPLRLLRAFRFAAQLGFKIDGDTLKDIETRPLKLRDVSGERIQLELMEVLEPDGVAEQVEQMDFVGLLWPLFPELAWQKGLEQNEYHHLDVWEHTLEAIRHIERIMHCEDEILRPYAGRISEYIEHEYPSGHRRGALIKLAVLLHDIAKPHCRGQREDGRVTFIGHERRGSDLAGEHLEYLRFPRYERNFVCSLIEGHLRPAVYGRDEPTRPKIAYRFFRDYEDAALGIIMVSLSDRLAAQGKLVTDEVNERHRNAISYLLECLFDETGIVVRPAQLVDGGTLIHELGVEPGPVVGHLLKRVQEAQVMGEVKTREEALAYCRKIMGES